jgi:hypothetical protein
MHTSQCYICYVLFSIALLYCCSCKEKESQLWEQIRVILVVGIWCGATFIDDVSGELQLGASAWLPDSQASECGL